jgi:hypothetical protein
MKKYFILFPALIVMCACNNGSTGKDQKDAKDSIPGASAAQPMNEEEREMKEMAEKQKNERPKESPYKNAKIDIKVFNNEAIKSEQKLTGYGYDILIYDALYVHQPHIPAINGSRGFKTKEQATKAAEFVIYKIRNNIMPPSLSVEELDSLGTLK